MARTAFITTLLVLCVFAEMLHAQIQPFRSYSIELGLSESVAHALVQDKRGYLWVGTGYGLNRFDGKRFKQYYEEDGLSNNRIHSLVEDNNGSIWIGTDTGLSLLENDSIYVPDFALPLARFSITALFQDHEGLLWVGTDGNGVWQIDNERNLQSIDERFGLPVERIRDIAQTSDGAIWLGAREGMVKINGTDIQYFAEPFGTPELRIRDLHVDEYDQIWIATRSGLVLYSKGEFFEYGEDEGLNDDRIQSVTAESENRVWLGTESGVSLFDGETFKNYTREDGLPAVIIYDTMVDREGNIWFGTLGGGITIYVGDYFQSYTIDNGLTNNVVTGFEEDRNGNIWIATYGGGALQFDGEAFSVHNEDAGLADNKVYSVFEDSNGAIWIGTSEGVSIYEDGKIRTFTGIDYPLSSVRRIFEDTRSGEYWFATYNDGVFRMTETGYMRYHSGNGLLNNTIMDIKQDSSGDIWLATYGGASRFNGNQFSHLTIADGLPNNGVIHIYIDGEENVWFSTFNGIAMFDGDSVHRLPESETSETISYFTLQDQNGNYYVGTNLGLYRIVPEILLNSSDVIERLSSFRLFNKKQGLIANELNAGGSLLANDGTIWLGSVEGMSRFFPDNVRQNTMPPGIEFEEVMVSGETVNPMENHTFNNDQNFLQISYTGLHFEASDQIVYEYRMRGLDQGWQLTRETQIRYPSLSPNGYEFQIRAYNADGLVSEKTASFSFQILPPFYLRWWFFLLVGCVVISVIFFVIRYLSVRKQVDIERMRVQIASDLHDDVGASLTELALQTDFLQAGNVDKEIKATLKQLGEQSRKVVSSLDDIVWSIDSRNDTAGDLTDRMQDYVNQVLSAKGVQVQYDFSQLRMQEKLPVDVKENIYLIFKEAINNNAKHSNATKVNVNLSFSGKNFELIIHDNGTDINSSRKSGQGLRNMKMRASRIQSNIEISTQNGFKIKATGSIK